MQLRLELGPAEATDPARGLDVLVEVATGTPFATLRAPLATTAGLPPTASWRCGATLLDDAAPVGMPPLLDGARLDPVEATDGLPAEAPADADHTVDADIHVISGPGAGRRHPLHGRAVVVGRSRSADLQVPDPTMSRRHLRVEPIGQGALVSDLGSSNPGVLAPGGRGGAQRDIGADGVHVSPGERIGAGFTTMTLRRREHDPGRCDPTGEGTYLVHRRPRAPQPPRVPDLEAPSAPVPPAPARLNLIVLVVPLLVCLGAAAFLQNPIFLVFGALSPIVTLAQWLGDRRSRAREHRRALTEHAAALRRIELDLAERARAELAERRRRRPDLAHVLTVVRGRQAALWERRAGDDDALTVTLGIGTVTARCGVRADGETRHPALPDAPIELDLAAHRCVGVAGERGAATAVVASILGQAVTWNSPHDLRVVVLTAGPRRRADWRWAEFLPHARGGGAVHVVDHTREDARLEHLLGAALAPTARAASAPRPRTLVVLDAPPGALDVLDTVLRPGAEARVHVVCLAGSRTALPAECDAVVELTQGPATLTVADARAPQAPIGFVPDLPDSAWRLDLARALAPLRDPRSVADLGGADLPDQVALLDLFDLDATDPDAVLAAWRERPRSTVAPIGRGVHGVHHLDLRRDGPHLLVGGMTGAGKSELLRTLITSLAVGNRPDELGFVLIDYKGGSAFDGCAALPHVMGLVTDLEGSLTTRALVSLRVELRRREALLRAAGVDDLERYAVRRAHDPSLAALPRLVIVVDEFRALAEEHPDFVPGLVRVATQGRSLGVHLVLATQRPSGIVSPEIRANANLRIALRVRDALDSHDIIETDAAAALPASVPGRALLRVGGGGTVPVQIARADAPATRAAPPAPVRLLQAVDAGAAPIARDVAPSLPPQLSHAVGTDEGVPAREPSAPAAERDTRAPGGTSSSPSPELVAALTDAALRCGWRPAGGPDAPGSIPGPWLPELPSQIDLDDLPVPGATRANGWGPADSRAGGGGRGRTPECRHDDLAAVPFGLLDDPEHQAQPCAVWEPTGNVGVIGSAGSGRTTAALTLALSAAARTCPGRLHVYGIEATSSLGALASLPHTGAVVGAGDELRLRALVARLAAELARREAAPSARPAARVLVVVDGWERVRETLESIERGAPLEQLLDLLRHGPSVGIHVVLTGSRALLVGAVPALLTAKIVMGLADPADAMLAGLSHAEITRRDGGHPRPGRGRLLPGRLEVQVARPPATAPSESGAGPATPAPTQLAAADPGWHGASSHACGPSPARLDPLPTLVSLTEVTTQALARRGAETASATHAWLGMGFDGPVSVDVGSGALVCGPRGSGRTATLVTLAAGLARRRRPWLAVTTTPEDLAGLEHGRVVAPTDLPGMHAASADLLSRCRRLNGGAEPGLVVLVDDVDLLLDTPAELALSDLLRTPPARVALVAAGESRALAGRFRGLAADLRAAPVAVLLGTGAAERDLVGAAVPQLGSRRVPRGRAVVLTPSTVEGSGEVAGPRVVQVALRQQRPETAALPGRSP